MKRMPKILLAFLTFVAIELTLSCTRTEEVVRQETVVVHDTVRVRDTVTLASMISDTVTTFIVVRHGEKELTGSDPALTADGQARAEELRRILSQVAVAKIYSTPYVRTRQTVQPLATSKSLAITDYSTSTPYAQLVNQLLSENKGKTAVVSGHSNTVPDILKAFNSSFTVTIHDSSYDNLFLVSARAGKAPEILHLRYGKATP